MQKDEKASKNNVSCLTLIFFPTTEVVWHQGFHSNVKFWVELSPAVLLGLSPSSSSWKLFYVLKVSEAETSSSMLNVLCVHLNWICFTLHLQQQHHGYIDFCWHPSLQSQQCFLPPIEILWLCVSWLSSLVVNFDFNCSHDTWKNPILPSPV